MHLRFGSTRIVIYDGSTLVIRPDGTVVPGAPEDTDDYRATAEQQGYGTDTASLCKDHELTHVALAHWLGLDESPVIRAVATGVADPLTSLEEAAVLAIQRYAMAVGVDLMDTLPRWQSPSDQNGA